jgi:uncharacterized protein YdeI (BOF family)
MERQLMTTMIKTLALAAVVAMGTASLAMAQTGYSGNTSHNAAASGGSGTHQSAQKTGSGENNEKVLGNHNGYRPQ